MTDREREFEARKFFWAVMDRWGQTVDVETAQRQIAKIAQCIPPFTPLSELCSDCPPVGYPTDKTRCSDCPHRPRRRRA